MTDYRIARQNMVDAQIKPNKVTDPGLIAAFLDTPRERFVPKAQHGIAYIDEDLHIGNDRYLLEPMVLARLIQEARITPEDLVLEIGAGTGFGTAILARVANSVVAVEPSDGLANAAAANLQALNCDNAIVATAPFAEGYPKQAPYQAIVVNGAVHEIPHAWVAQLDDGGRLVCVVRGEGPIGVAKLVVKRGDVVSERALFDAATPFLRGFQPEPQFRF